MAIRVWYHVRNLGSARDFYTRVLGFEERFVDVDGRWARLQRGGMEIGLAEGKPQQDGGVATLDVDDAAAEAKRLRAQGIDTGLVFELHGHIRLLDVFDPDGNRIQLAQELA
jgi:catechol 2,3-dioxygenase-like lactoylglutathione lyase family enzyme